MAKPDVDSFMKVRYEEIVQTPNTASETLPVIKFMNQSAKGKKKSKSRTKKLKALTRS